MAGGLRVAAASGRGHAKAYPAQTPAISFARPNPAAARYAPASAGAGLEAFRTQPREDVAGENRRLRETGVRQRRRELRSRSCAPAAPSRTAVAARPQAGDAWSARLAMSERLPYSIVIATYERADAFRNALVSVDR